IRTEGEWLGETSGYSYMDKAGEPEGAVWGRGGQTAADVLDWNEGFPFLPSCLFKYPHQSEEFHQIQDGADQKNDPGIIAREYQNLECCPWKEYQIHNLTVFILSQLDWK
ncbi:MAG: hypothetical protein II568_05910, partial [Erysipelotrichaceae bacterium]|nr:hypothetical protein [Erysipelotrichaceae bacterium]